MLLVFAVVIFLSAGTFHYWQAWVFLAVFGVLVTIITGYLAVSDPQLLERRVHAGPWAEKEKSQMMIQAIAQVAFLLLIMFPALDHRLAWSRMQACISLAGDGLVILGCLIVFKVFKENTFTAAIIEVSVDQKVISTGPYAIVRHPMYSGAIVMLLGVPIALGSWWGLLAVFPVTIVIIARLLDEEKYLVKNLPGYTEYCARVRWHLMPGVF